MPTKRKGSKTKKLRKKVTRRKSVVKRKKRSNYGSSVRGKQNFKYPGKYQPGRSLRELQTKSHGGPHSGFGALDVPNGMRSVSSYRKAGTYNRPFLMMPFGPPQRWMEKPPGGQQGPSSSMAPPNQRRSKYGSSRSLKGKYVNPSGYLATWYGQPRTPPPSWNPLLLQGQNTFRQGIDSPRLSNVVVPQSNFGRRRRKRRYV